MPPSISRMRGGAGGFEVMLEYMQLYHPSLDVNCPLATYTGRESIESVES